MRTVDDILNLYKERQVFYGPLHSKMRMIQSIYNGTFEVPLPDVERSEMPSNPNLLAMGVDQMAGRVTSVIPAVNFSSVKPGTRKFDRLAQTSSRTVTAWWQADRLPLKMKNRGRHFIAYGMSPVVVRWNREENRPTWHVRHPMETYPSTEIIPGQITPRNCIFSYRRPAGWLRANGYSDKLYALTGKVNYSNESPVTLIEYIDEYETVLIAAGYQQQQSPFAPINLYDESGSALKGVVLERTYNGTDETPVVVPMRITLDTAVGQFDNMIGMFYQQAKIMALEVIAVEKGIFPDTYLVSRPGEIARFIDGPHDGRTGLINIIAGGDIRSEQAQPGYLTNPTIDRLERSQRVTAGIPAEFGGESTGNVRTGRRGDAVLSAVIDYPVAEAQEMFSYALEEEDEVAIGLAKYFDGNSQRTMFIGTGNAMRPVTYVPNETFLTSEHVVSYPATGSDLNQLVIGIGQRVGLGIMSKRTASMLDPYIDNPELEHDQIIAEGLEQALVSGLQQQASSGQIPPAALAKVMKMVKDDKMELAEAFDKVMQEAIDQQQQQQETPTPESVGAPGALAALGGPQAAQMAAVNGPNQSQMNLGNLLNTLRRGARV